MKTIHKFNQWFDNCSESKRFSMAMVIMFGSAIIGGRVFHSIIAYFALCGIFILLRKI